MSASCREARPIAGADMMQAHQLRNLALGLVALICLGFSGVVAYRLISDPTQFRAPIGGAFALENVDGKRVTDADFRGRYLMVYFGYTHCPDICPTKLIEMTNALEAFEADKPELARLVAPVFITVDPERDTNAILREYMGHFHPRFVALSGPETAIAEVAEAYRVYYRRVPTEDGKDYVMDHTSYVFLLGPDGRYVTHYTANDDAAAMAQNLAFSIRKND